MCLFFVVSCYLFEQLPKSVSATLYFTELGCSNVAEDRRQGKEKNGGEFTQYSEKLTDSKFHVSQIKHK